MNKAEELARKYCEGSSFEDACMERPAYIAGYHQAEKDLEIARDEVIEETVKWLRTNSVNYLDKCNNPTYMGGYFIKIEDMVNGLKKAMEDKV